MRIACLRLCVLTLAMLMASCLTPQTKTSGESVPVAGYQNDSVQKILTVNHQLEEIRQLMRAGQVTQAEQLLLPLKQQPYFQQEIALLEQDIKNRHELPGLKRRQGLTHREGLAEVKQRLILPKTYGKTYTIQPNVPLPDHFPTGPMEELVNRPVSFNVENADVRTLILALSDIDGLNIIADEALSSDQTLTIKVKNVPLRELLSYISRNLGIAFHFGENLVWVTAAQDMNSSGPKLDTLIYHLQTGYIPSAAGNSSDSSSDNGGDTGADTGDFSDVAAQLSSTSGNAKGQDDLLKALNDFLKNNPDNPPEALFRIYRNRNLLVIRNTVENVRLAEEIIKAFDQPPVQILIEARFLTISQDDLFQLGTTIQSISYEKDLLKKLQVDASSQLPSFGNAVSSPGKLGVSGVINNVTYSALIEAFQQAHSTDTLSAPRVTVINNQHARLRRGEVRYYFDTYEQTTTGGTEPATSIVPSGDAKKLETGITLEVQPSVGNDLKTISLSLNASISNFIRFEELSPEISMPLTNENRVKTTMLVNSGQTVVLGGMLSTENNKAESKVPILGDIPLLGMLFRKRETVERPVHLLIFVTATIVDPDGYFRSRKKTNAAKEK